MSKRKNVGGFPGMPAFKPGMQKKLSGLYLQSFYKFLKKAYESDNQKTVKQLLNDVEKALFEAGAEVPEVF